MAARGTNSSHHDDEYVKVMGYDKSKEAIIGTSHGDDDKHVQLEDKSKESSSSKPDDMFNGKKNRVLSSEETKKWFDELEERRKIPIKGPFYIPYVPSNKPNGEPGYIFPLEISIPRTRLGLSKIDLNDETDTDDDGTGETDTDSDGYGVFETETETETDDGSGTEDENDDDHDASAKKPRVG